MKICTICESTCYKKILVCSNCGNISAFRDMKDYEYIDGDYRVQSASSKEEAKKQRSKFANHQY